MNDQQLFISYLLGNEEAFDELYKRHSKLVRNTINKYLSPKYQRELQDIVQFFWMELLRYAHNYDQRRPFRNWLLACAVKSISNYKRKFIDQCHSVNQLDDQSTTSFCEEAHYLESREPSPVAQACLVESTTSAQEALERLPEHQREVLTGIYLQGKTIAKYATETGLSEGTVKSRLNRGLNALRQQMGAST